MNVGGYERREIAAAMRGSVLKSGLTQTDFALHLGTSATRLSTYLTGTTIPSAAIYLRALRLGAAFEHAREQGLMTPDTAADVVNRALARRDENFALQMILQARDHFRAAALESDEVWRLWERRARLIDDVRFDTLFRAIIARASGEDAPAWAADARLDDEWFFPDPFGDDDSIRAQTPDWLARAHIYIAERDLATA